MPNVTMRAARACDAAEVAADVVVGSAYPYLTSLRRWARRHPLITVHENVGHMEQLMARADIAIGAPGSATWERCSLGLPAIVVVLADNQARIAEAVVRAGCAVSAGWHHDVDVRDLVNMIQHLKQSPSRVRAMSAAAWQVTDGMGVYRVVDTIEVMCAARADMRTMPGQWGDGSVVPMTVD